MATATNDVDELRRQMATIRHELHEDVRGVVASAEAVTDWHRYIRSHPWIALGAAVGVGFMIVPRRHSTVVRSVEPATIRRAEEEVRETVQRHPVRTVMGAAFGILAPVAVRAVQGYAVRYVEGWIAQLQEQQMMQGGRPFPSPSGPVPKAGT